MVDRFDLIYNTERPHQGLPGRITPQQSWNATAVAEAPRPKPIPVLHEASAPAPVVPGLAEPVADAGPEAPEPDPGASASGKIGGIISHPADTGSRKLRVYSNGVVKIGPTLFSLSKRMGGRIVIAAWDPDGVVFANTEGEVIAEYSWSPEGTGYVGTGKSLTRIRA